MNVDDDVNKRKYSRIVKKLAVNNYMSIPVIAITSSWSGAFLQLQGEGKN